jgi:hypothetical protein
MTTPWRRAGAELALLLVISLFMGAIAPFGTETLPPARTYVYWLACIIGGGVIGISIDETLGVRAGAFWPRLAVSSVAMTPAVTLLVLLVSHFLAGQSLHLTRYLGLIWNVWVISAPVMALRALVWRRPHTIVETRVIVEPPLPEAEAVFRRRLSARRRAARLIAVEAYDHYLRVHTDAGAELITARFAEALDELAGAHGLQTHRSWWVASDAIQSVQWRRGVGEARLAGEITAPVSRTHAPALRAAGWF